MSTLGSGARGGITPAKFTIRKLGSYYHVHDEMGFFRFSSSSLEVAVNDEAFNGLTAGRIHAERVLMKGDLALDDTLIQEENTILSLDGRIKLANAVNKNMLENKNRATHDSNCIVEGGVWDGNRQNQTAGTGHIIDWQNSTDSSVGYPEGDTYPVIEIRDLRAIHAYDSGLKLRKTGDAFGMFRIHDIECNGNRGLGGIETYDFADCRIYDIHICDGIYMESASCAQLHDIYLNPTNWNTASNLKLLKCYNVVFSDIFMDCSYLLPVDLKAVHYCLFNNINIRVASGLNGAAWDRAVYLQDSGGGDGYCNNIGFNNFFIGRGYRGGATQRWTTGIEEADLNQDNNQFSNINGLDCVTQALILKGAASKGQHQNILGTVTEL